MKLTIYLFFLSFSLISGSPKSLEYDCDCLNGGECVLLPDGEPGCSCPIGFYGKSCEVDQISERSMKQKLPNNDKIRKIKCFNNGTVIYDKFGRLRCSCKTRTTGAKCEFVLPVQSSCLPNPCQNGGACADTNNGYKCTCPPAYTGVYCQNAINQNVIGQSCGRSCDPCSQNPCSVNGQCFNVSCSAQCVCNPGFTGTFCNIPLTITTTSSSTTPCPSTIQTTTSPYNQCDPCSLTNCNMNGQCYNFSCIPYCECKEGYTGNYCETPLSTNPILISTTPIYPFIPCQANTCSNNGDCFSLSGQAYCVCNDGWTGERCDVPLPSVSTTTIVTPPACNPCGTGQNPCTQFGQCVNASCIAYCVCDPGYTGDICDIPLPTTPVPVTTTPLPTSSNRNLMFDNMSNRCNFSIGLFNDGAFTTRFKVEYKLDGITQALIRSTSLSIIGQSTYNTIPYYATDIVVTIEVLGWSWFIVKEDSNITTATFCTKCYKTWGTVTGVHVDFIKC